MAGKIIIDEAGAKRLACAILSDAVEKATGSKWYAGDEVRPPSSRKRYIKREEQSAALRFIESRRVLFWCRIADVDVERVRKAARIEAQ